MWKFFQTRYFYRVIALFSTVYVMLFFYVFFLQETWNVIIVGDSVAGTLTLVKSLWKYASPETKRNLNITVLTTRTDLVEYVECYLSDRNSIKRLHIRTVEFDQEYGPLSTWAMSSHIQSNLNYARFFMAEWLNTMDYAVFMDHDIVVMDDIGDFFKANKPFMNDSYTLVAVRTPVVLKEHYFDLEKLPKRYQRIDLKSPAYNAGFGMWNFKLWRERKLTREFKRIFQECRDEPFTRFATNPIQILLHLDKTYYSEDLKWHCTDLLNGDCNRPTVFCPWIESGYQCSMAHFNGGDAKPWILSRHAVQNFERKAVRKYFTTHQDLQEEACHTNFKCLRNCLKNIVS